MNSQEFIEISNSFFVDRDYKAAFESLGLTSIDAIFSFNAGKNLAKDNLAKYRSRLQFETGQPPKTIFLKRYDRPPILTQIRNWLACRSRKSLGLLDYCVAEKLSALGVNTPKTIAYGQQWGIFFEKRSFIATEKIPNAESLERKLPDCFNAPPAPENLKLQRNFIAQLGIFVGKFHKTDYRHRDLYLSHIFYNNKGEFCLIDLSRAFKPILLVERYRIKDVAQLNYSSPRRYFSKTDRLRFYMAMTGQKKLNDNDKTFIRRVISKTKRIAKHDIKHGRPAPFAS